jgi:hypothetical protein
MCCIPDSVELCLELFFLAGLLCQRGRDSCVVCWALLPSLPALALAALQPPPLI